MSGESVAEFAQRASIEFGYWAELSREVAANLEAEGYDATPAWVTRDTWAKASRQVLTLAEGAS